MRCCTAAYVGVGDTSADWRQTTGGGAAAAVAAAFVMVVSLFSLLGVTKLEDVTKSDVARHLCWILTGSLLDFDRIQDPSHPGWTSGWISDWICHSH